MAQGVYRTFGEGMVMGPARSENAAPMGLCIGLYLLELKNNFF
jgi:hypothetical protein